MPRMAAMQPDRFTVKAQEAVAGAIQLAAMSSNTEATPQHLLVALIAQPDGLVVPVLNKLSADVDAIRERADRAVAELPTISAAGDNRPSPSPAFVETLRRAE